MLVCIPEKQSTSSERTVVRWTCSPEVARPLLHLARWDRPHLLQSIRTHYRLDEDKGVVLKLRFVSTPVETLDTSWERRVLVLMSKLLDLEHLMWNLSTLGGAYSAMGDYDRKFADQAAVISQHQLRVASELGDPALVARCYLYIALSMAQRGNPIGALDSVRLIQRWARFSSNDLLIRCCRGIRMKIRSIQLLGK